MQTNLSILCIFLLLIIQTKNDTLSDTLTCLEQYIETFKPKMSDKLFSMFKASYPNTLSTTVKNFNLTPGNESTYIITGDIEAMWLRDSTNQFLPYMKIQKICPKIRQLAKGLLNMQAEFIMTDPYTNAFKRFENPQKPREFYLNDKTQVLILGIPVDLSRHKQFATKSIWERKFEIDSLASFLRLAYEYQQRYESTDIVNLKFIKAIRRILTTLDQQSKDVIYERSKTKRFYTFFRDQKELELGQIKESFATGMIKTGFRPSDDPNDYAYNIPGNAMMATYLDFVARKILMKISSKSVFKVEADILAQQMKHYSKSITVGIQKYGIIDNQYAYEVNGKGQFKLFDDANLPSLLSLPYLKFVQKTNIAYMNTRSFVLSQKNPYFFSNSKIKGVGSSHTPARNIWPLALITQILTTDNAQEVKQCLSALTQHSMDNLNHESFNIDNPQSITRNWFAWANSYFGEMIITLSQKMPEVLI